MRRDHWKDSVFAISLVILLLQWHSQLSKLPTSQRSLQQPFLPRSQPTQLAEFAESHAFCLPYYPIQFWVFHSNNSFTCAAGAAANARSSVGAPWARPGLNLSLFSHLQLLGLVGSSSRTRSQSTADSLRFTFECLQRQTSLETVSRRGDSQLRLFNCCAL